MLVISSRLFTYDSATDTFSTELSLLEHEITRQGYAGFEHRDGKHGFHMQSHRTHQLLWFELAGDHRDREGELEWVEFRGNLTPNRRLELRAYND